MKIGPYTLDNPLILAPMAGITDRPFRVLCREQGAALAVSEMVTSNKQLWHSRKTQLRLDHTGETTPRSVQIAGTDPGQMAEAALFNVEHGAQIIDINMGCPAKKVCNKWAGSALMQDEALALQIVEAVVAAAAPHGVPVTLKMRTGWCADGKNAPVIARAAEAAGVQMLTVHGRTREQGYSGFAEHETVAHIKSRVKIPVVANGDIDSPRKAAQVLAQTGADALMIGRAAQGRPWIFREIAHYLATGSELPAPDLTEVKAWLLDHLEDHYHLYGEYTGVRSARKHLAWYARALPVPSTEADAFRRRINRMTRCEEQQECVRETLDAWAAGERLAEPNQQEHHWKLAA